MIAPVEGSGSTPAWMSFVGSRMVQRYFIQFNKSLTRHEQHGDSRFALLFAGFEIAFTAFGMKGLPGADLSGVFTLPVL
jgi:hypothetical protein